MTNPRTLLGTHAKTSTREPADTASRPQPAPAACGCGSGCNCGCQSGGSCQCGGTCG